MKRDPLDEKEVVVHVPPGQKDQVRIVECDPADLQAEIVVQVSKKRKATTVPVLGVIVK